MGGRKKGVPNKAVIPLREKAEKLGLDPFQMLLHFANANWEALGYSSPTETKYTARGEAYEVPLITPEHRLRALTELCQYLYPKLKAIEHTGKEAEVKASTVIILPSNGRELKK